MPIRQLTNRRPLTNHTLFKLKSRSRRPRLPNWTGDVKLQCMRCGSQPRSTVCCKKSPTGVQLRPQSGGTPFANSITQHRLDPYDVRCIAGFQEENRQSATQLHTFFDQCAETMVADLDVVGQISKGTLSQLAADRDASTALAVQQSRQADLIRNSLRVARLAASIGTTLGYDEQTLIDLGIGCLIHDIGLMCLDGTVCQHTAAKPELGTLIRHPELTLQLLQEAGSQIPQNSLMVAYQMHERCDGSGYPYGYDGSRIHELAKVAAVADLYTALVSPGPRRRPKPPYDAMKEILHAVKRGELESKIVRAMLLTICLCPVGSHVELTNHNVARVLRANQQDYLRPVVEMYWNRNFSGEPLVVDLAEEQELQIVRTANGPPLMHDI